jgi:hypothetical protein
MGLGGLSLLLVVALDAGGQALLDGIQADACGAQQSLEVANVVVIENLLNSQEFWRSRELQVQDGS